MKVLAYHQWPNRKGGFFWAGLPATMLGVAADRESGIVHVAGFGNVRIPLVCIMPLEAKRGG